MRERCVVCADELLTDAVRCVAMIPCGHVFHCHCLNDYKRRNNHIPNCPECKNIEQRLVILNYNRSRVEEEPAPEVKIGEPCYSEAEDPKEEVLVLRVQVEKLLKSLGEKQEERKKLKRVYEGEKEKTLQMKKEISELKQTIDKKNSEMKKIKGINKLYFSKLTLREEEISQKKLEISDLINLRDKYQLEMGQLEEYRAQSENEKRELKQSITERQNAVDELKKTENENKLEIASLLQSNKKYEEDLKQSQQLVSLKEQEISRLAQPCQKCSTFESEIEKLRQQAMDLQKKIARLEEENSTKREKISKLQQINKSYGEKKKADGELDSKKQVPEYRVFLNAKKHLKEQIASLKDKNIHYLDRLKKPYNNKAHWKQKYFLLKKEYRDKITKLDKMESIRKARIQHLHSRLHSHNDKDCKNLKKTLELKKQVKELGLKLSRSRRKLVQAQELNDQVNKNMSNLEKKLNDSKEGKFKLQKELENLRKINIDQKTEVSNLLQNKQNLEKTINYFTKKSVEYFEEIKTLQNAANENEARLQLFSQLELENDQLRQSNSKLDQELNSFKQSCDVNYQTITDLQNTNAQMLHDIHNLRLANDDLQRQLSQMASSNLHTSQGCANVDMEAKKELQNMIVVIETSFNKMKKHKWELEHNTIPHLESQLQRLAEENSALKAQLESMMPRNPLIQMAPQESNFLLY